MQIALHIREVTGADARQIPQRIAGERIDLALNERLPMRIIPSISEGASSVDAHERLFRLASWDLAQESLTLLNEVA